MVRCGPIAFWLLVASGTFFVARTSFAQSEPDHRDAGVGSGASEASPPPERPAPPADRGDDGGRSARALGQAPPQQREVETSAPKDRASNGVNAMAHPPAVVPPKPLTTGVEYPEGATGVSEVVLEITVDATGRVSDTLVLDGEAPFAEAAREGARAWSFSPATRNGAPVAARIRYTLRFEPPPLEEPALPAPNTGRAGAPVPSASAARPVPPPSEVFVRGERTPTGSVRITREEARNLPGSFGDPIRTIESLPGVVPIVSGLPSFFIRGAPPANVGFFIDGIDVPLLYHAFFGPSVLHPSIIESVDLYRGAAPVEFGRFAGPIVAATSSAVKPRWSGEASVRAIDSGVLVQGPLVRCASDGDPECARTSVRVSGRYSYTGLVLSLLSDAQLNYWDYQGQASVALGPRDTLSVFSFGAYDFFQADKQSENERGGKVQFHRFDVRHDHRFSPDVTLRTAVTVGYDRTGATDDSGSTVHDTSFRARLQLEATPHRTLALHAGVDARRDQFGLDTNPVYLSYSDYKVLFPARDQTILGAYASAEWRPTPAVTVSPGVRADRYAELGTTAFGVDPRVALSVALSKSLTLDHTVGMAHQQPNFAAQVPGAQVADLAGGLQEAWLWSSGVRWKGASGLTVSATAFMNAYFQALDPIGGSRDFGIDRTMLDRRSTIHARGIELGISRPLTNRIGGFFNYTLSRSEQTNGSTGGPAHVSGFDRPHVVQAALTYDLGKGVRAGARAVIYSGVPELSLEGSPHFTANRRGKPYFRMDARVEKRWLFGERTWLAVVGEMLNVTSTREVVRLDCGTLCAERVSGPVMLPSIGIEGGL